MAAPVHEALLVAFLSGIALEKFRHAVVVTLVCVCVRVCVCVCVMLVDVSASARYPGKLCPIYTQRV